MTEEELEKEAEGYLKGLYGDDYVEFDSEKQAYIAGAKAHNICCGCGLVEEYRGLKKQMSGEGEK